MEVYQRMLTRKLWCQQKQLLSIRNLHSQGILCSWQHDTQIGRLPTTLSSSAIDQILITKNASLTLLSPLLYLSHKAGLQQTKGPNFDNFVSFISFTCVFGRMMESTEQRLETDFVKIYFWHTQLWQSSGWLFWFVCRLWWSLKVKPSWARFDLWSQARLRHHICRDRCDRRSRKSFVNCVNFSANNANYQ